jgi:hypothetical protein
MNRQSLKQPPTEQTQAKILTTYNSHRRTGCKQGLFPGLLLEEIGQEVEGVNLTLLMAFLGQADVS